MMKKIKLSAVLLVVSIVFAIIIHLNSSVVPPQDKLPSEENKLAVVIMAGGIYDTPLVLDVIREYISSVEYDLSVPSVGIAKFDGKSVAELEDFIDNLYDKENVRFVVLVGDDFPSKKGFARFSILQDIEHVGEYSISGSEHAYSWIRLLKEDIEQNKLLPGDKFRLQIDFGPKAPPRKISICKDVRGKYLVLSEGKNPPLIFEIKVYYPPEAISNIEEKFIEGMADYKKLTTLYISGNIGDNGVLYATKLILCPPLVEIAVSWVLPPVVLSPSDKQQFVVRVLREYIYYHNNFNTIKEMYIPEVLQIIWDDTLPKKVGFPLHAPVASEAYGLPINTTLLNSNHAFVRREFKKSYVGLKWYVHGSSTTVGIGLSEDTTTPRSSSAVFTSRQDYIAFSNAKTKPFLFVNPFSCGMFVIDVQDELGGWPQVMLGLGVWAYGDNAKATDKSIGHNILGKPVFQWIMFGDIMAHF